MWFLTSDVILCEQWSWCKIFTKFHKATLFDTKSNPYYHILCFKRKTWISLSTILPCCGDRKYPSPARLYKIPTAIHSFSVITFLQNNHMICPGYGLCHRHLFWFWYRNEIKNSTHTHTHTCCVSLWGPMFFLPPKWGRVCRMVHTRNCDFNPLTGDHFGHNTHKMWF